VVVKKERFINLWSFSSSMDEKISVCISGTKVFPKQSLDDKIGIVATMDYISKHDTFVRIGISNKSDVLHGQSEMTLIKKDFEEFLEMYNLKKDQELVGKPVISVYTRKYGEMILGVIPLYLN
jgi:hypothetical protein